MDLRADAIEYDKRIDRVSLISSVLSYFKSRYIGEKRDALQLDLSCVEMRLSDSESKLFSYQKGHFYALVDILLRNGIALDASDTGTGKTFVALAIARLLDLHPFVICPLSVIYSWKRAAEYFSLDITVSNYESAKQGKVKVFSSNSMNRTNSVRDGRIRILDGVPTLIPGSYTLMIFDEMHRCKNKKTANYKMLDSTIKHRAAESKILLLSATAIDRPKNFRGLGYFLNMYGNSDYDYYAWAIRHKTIPILSFATIFYNIQLRNEPLFQRLSSLVVDINKDFCSTRL